ncbi:hypothetical protein L1077_21615 [Pseudoalteromonas luteoviolacea]|uniref:phage head-tail joining protein n=1 Tax=Pseudoalteromonas luteoviolacea TaxID=43657 RepID=UPI001F419409|nr:hypothetical protein [Pseudoalteromonas luteoviolacea]MCF6442032.1 hypothetical protein [Pseudoalteromonas luteoviolacea]
MALSQNDLDELDSAIASAELSVEIDGKKVVYRSIGDLKTARRHIANVLAKKAGRKSGPYGPAMVTRLSRRF